MKVLFIANSFFELTETFVHHQIKGATADKKILVANEFKNEKFFALEDTEKYKIRLIPIHFIDRVVTKIKRMIADKRSYEYSVFNSLTLQKIIRTKNIDLIHAHFGPNGVRALPIAKKAHVPLIVSFHGFDASELMKKERYVEDLKDLFSYAKSIITVSKTLSKNLSPYVMSNKRIKIIPYGIDLDIFKGSSHEGTAIKIFHIGRLVRKKGVIELVEVFSSILQEITQVELHIVGDGPDLEQIRALIKQDSLENKVKLYGSRNHAEVINYFKEADIFVLNSRTSEKGDQEGLPNTILEAMASGCAVLSTKHSGISEVIDEKNGVLVNERDQNALRAELVRLIKNKELRANLGQTARSTAVHYFGLKHMNEEYAKIYREAVE